MSSTDPAVAARILAMTKATHKKLEPQMAVVARAMIAAGRPASAGFSQEALEAPLPLKAANMVALLEASFADDVDTEVDVEGVLGQWAAAVEAMDAVGRGLAANDLDEGRVDALKRGALFLSRLHDEVKGDLLLSQLFPAPTVLTADASNL